MISTLKIERIVTNWIKRKYLRRVFRRALNRAYVIFAQRYPEWAASHFDEYFLIQYLNPSGQDIALPKPDELADAWTKQIPWFKEATRQRLITELTPVASDYLQWLKKELCRQETVSKLIAQAA